MVNCLLKKRNRSSYLDRIRCCFFHFVTIYFVRSICDVRVINIFFLGWITLGYTLPPLDKYYSTKHPPDAKTLPDRTEMIPDDGGTMTSNKSTRAETVGFQSTVRQNSFQKGKVIRLLVLMLLVFAMCWLVRLNLSGSVTNFCRCYFWDFWELAWCI